MKHGHQCNLIQDRFQQDTKETHRSHDYIPLCASAAKTVHRSQDDTVVEIVVDLKCTRKFGHIHFVDLSRVTSMKSLHMINLQKGQNQYQFISKAKKTTFKRSTFFQQFQIS